ncbi:MAG: eukaryotic-like serine/threonine-protein kinase [Acidobacteriota bacterium]|jgi:Tol biopolymer transport system component|nr:eukaryotic-like serine/threonine-protein kinase [Acidobacteriota bacterium]
MGDVYRAVDTRLNRSVAIKVLPAQDAVLRERMAREARAISGVPHPNICALYDVGSEAGADYLVMEYLEGETLAAKLSRGPLPFSQVLRVGAEIASALDVAHRAGVVHRDLKPGNIMLTKSGARLLDFGLARNMAPVGPDAPTAREALTEAGMVVGTLQYMSPEQLEGSAVDARSDIFAFGCVLYEMTTGRRAFDGETRTGVITAILTRDPEPPSSIVGALPIAIDRVVARCLAKDREERWQSAHDLADELRWMAQDRSSSSQRTAVASKPRRRFLDAALIAALLVALAFAAVMWRRGSAARTPETMLFTMSLPPGATLSQRAVTTELAVSPDGKQIALAVVHGGRRSIIIRELAALSYRELAGTDGAVSPFWSPDGKWLGFFAEGKMKKVPAAGGPVQVICDARGSSASWSENGEIIFSEWGPDTSDELQAVSESGGKARVVTTGEGWHNWPFVVSNSGKYLATNISPTSRVLTLNSLDDKSQKNLGNAIRTVADDAGNVYYVRDGVLVTQHLDVGSARLTGDAVPLFTGAFQFADTGGSNLSVSRDGSVIAVQRMALPTQLVWRDRNGREAGLLGTPQLYRKFRISPDHMRVATEIAETDTQRSNIWVQDIQRGVSTRITSSASEGISSPIWSSHGDVLFVTAPASTKPGDAPQIAPLSLSTGRVEPPHRTDGPQYATDITPDGRVIYTVSRGRDTDVELLSADGKKKQSLLGSTFNESDAVLSPDGRWLAFQADDSGRVEVYLQPFGREGERSRVSTDGGVEPRWSLDGKELYYINAASMLNAVAIDATGRPGATEMLFPINSATMLEQKEFGPAHYDIGAVRDRFLVREIPSGADDPPVIIIIRR